MLDIGRYLHIRYTVIPLLSLSLKGEGGISYYPAYRIQVRSPPPPFSSKVPTSSAHPFHPSRSSRDAFQKPLHSPSRRPPSCPPGEDRADISSPAPSAWRSYAAAPQAHGRQQDHGIRRVLELAPLARLGAPPWLGDVTVPARDLLGGGRPHNNDKSQSGTSPAPPAKILATKSSSAVIPYDLLIPIPSSTVRHPQSIIHIRPSPPPTSSSLLLRLTQNPPLHQLQRAPFPAPASSFD